jgi:ABC-2 type transport system permease protein
VLGFLLVATMFGALVYAILAVGGGSLGSGALDTLIVGFALWQLGATSYSSASSDIAEELRQRTIEQLCVTPLPLSLLLGLRALLHVLLGILGFVLIWLVINWLTDGRLKASPGSIVGIMSLAVPALVGTGYATAGLLLLMKRAEVMHALIYLGLISLVALPAYPVNALAFLPYTLGAAAAKAAASGVAISESVYWLIAANSVGYLVVGIGIFQFLQRRARNLGVLGHL